MTGKVQESQCEVDNIKQQLEKLQNTENPERIRIQNENSLLLTDFQVKYTKLEKDMDQVIEENKKIQNSLKEMEGILAYTKAAITKCTSEKETNDKILKDLHEQISNVSNEIKYVQVSQQATKVFDKPPQKPSRQTLSQPSQSRKRNQIEAESDGSTDGNTLSYTEFMAKKKAVQKLKR